MIKKNIRVNNEFYVCPVYNEAIGEGKKIVIDKVSEMHGLGTPDDLKNFITKNTSYYYNPMPGCAMTINSALADKIFYSKYMVMHDWWILLSAMHENTTVLYIDLPLVGYRQHSGNFFGYKK